MSCDLVLNADGDIYNPADSIDVDLRKLLLVDMVFKFNN